MMEIIKTEFEGLFVIEPTVFEDERGYFLETFNQAKFAELTGISPVFVQDNESMSDIFTLRGLHYQKGEYAQAKLVRVVEGSVIDIALDLRRDSKTYGQHYSVHLSGENKKQLYIPRGFAHGFSVITDESIVSYKCDNIYNKNSEAGVNPFDETLNIHWYVNSAEAIISDKDKNWPNLCNIKK
jgi:dTDP-4-dehydrorhamnose 3,5-epimerase